jgi:hypothetical protein
MRLRESIGAPGSDLPNNSALPVGRYGGRQRNSLSFATDFAGRRNNISPRRSWNMIENGGNNRMNICIDPRARALQLHPVRVNCLT